MAPLTVGELRALIDGLRDDLPLFAVIQGADKSIVKMSVVGNVKYVEGLKAALCLWVENAQERAADAAIPKRTKKIEVPEGEGIAEGYTITIGSTGIASSGYSLLGTVYSLHPTMVEKYKELTSEDKRPISSHPIPSPLTTGVTHALTPTPYIPTRDPKTYALPPILKSRYEKPEDE